MILEEGEIAVVTREGVRVTDARRQAHRARARRITWEPVAAEKGGYKHFMLKEIHEQPRADRRHAARARISTAARHAC